MRYLKLIWQLFVITSALYLIRPCEAFIKAFVRAYKEFKWEFKDVWARDGWSSLNLYGKAFIIFKEKK